MTSRTFVVGDVHGCRDELAELLALFGPVQGDRLASVGDMLNKGPDSAGVVDLAREVGLRCAMGNHEARLLRMMSVPPAEWKPKEWKFSQRLGPRMEEIAAEVATWPLWIDLGDLLVVHGGLQPGVSRLQDMERNVLLTVRTWDGTGQNMDNPSDPAWFDLVKWPVPVVFGHWAARGLVDLPGFKGLDTGCVYGRRLTGWCPEENRFYHVPARRAYATMT